MGNEMLEAALKAAQTKYEAALAVRQYVVAKAAADAKVERRESEIMADICAETNEGKPIYSNDTARKAQLVARSMNDDQLRTLAREQDEAAEKLVIGQAIHALNHDLHRAYVAAMYAMRED
jgi:hypothetical protein